jgi:GNAT superfamily N-acetyltransferase
VNPDIQFVSVLADHPRLFAFVLTAFADGIDSGAFPAGRLPPTGTESCAFHAPDGVEPIAFATFYQPDERSFVWLDLLWVEPEFRERGWGGAIIQALADRSRRVGHSHLEFGTLASNGAMQQLAEKIGCDRFTIGYRLELAHG